MRYKYKANCLLTAAEAGVERPRLPAPRVAYATPWRPSPRLFSNAANGEAEVSTVAVGRIDTAAAGEGEAVGTAGGRVWNR